MGKGDIKSKKGKISNGSYGVRRPRKSAPFTALEIAEAKLAKAALNLKAEKTKTVASPKAEKAPAAKKVAKAKAE